jgi:serine/threonine-protein kinase RsbW
MSASIHPPSFPYKRRLPSTLDAADGVAREVRALLAAHGLAGAAFAVELCLRECLNNAVLHGNRGDAARHVDCTVACGPRWIRLAVRDEGPGFDWRATRRRPLSAETADSGRGLPIFETYCRRIRHNRKGNEITLWLARGPVSAERPHASAPLSARRKKNTFQRQ